ncbi:MAG: hypothetical protein CVU54_07070 [Deltaproteobacteria bacterium HGW-Deltaproteobacteria-12]|nr:MAG: hypothetical protein CVU54_07070 [Deltaproteobacteria bacterium HGW-Deltaproteobacteria-12]
MPHFEDADTNFSISFSLKLLIILPDLSYREVQPAYGYGSVPGFLEYFFGQAGRCTVHVIRKPCRFRITKEFARLDFPGYCIMIAL